MTHDGYDGISPLVIDDVEVLGVGELVQVVYVDGEQTENWIFDEQTMVTAFVSYFERFTCGISVIHMELKVGQQPISLFQVFSGSNSQVE